MYKIIALIGKSGAGKDTLMQKLLSLHSNFHEIISCTSRPIREGEQEGVNYYYYSPEGFEEKIIKKEMLESTVFNNWYYGTSYDSVAKDKINIGVFNPAGVKQLLAHPEVDLKVIYVRAADKTRLLRQLTREDHPDCAEIIRRYTTDEKDFAHLDCEYISIDNEHFLDLREGVVTIIGQLQPWIDQGQE